MHEILARNSALAAAVATLALAAPLHQEGRPEG